MRLIQTSVFLLLLLVGGCVQNKTQSQIFMCTQMATSEPSTSWQNSCARVQIHNAKITQRHVQDGEGSLVIEVSDSKQKYYLGIKKTTAIFIIRTDQTSQLVDVSAIATGQLIDVLVDQDGVSLSNPSQANAEEIFIKR